jgi:PKD domain-containing protein
VLATALVALLLVSSGPETARADRGMPRPAVVPTATPSTALSVALNLSDAAPVARQKVNLTAMVSGGTAPYACKWTFGDGTSGSNCTTSHTWTRSGAYKLTVTVSDSAADTTSKSIAITVANPPPPGGGSSGLSPSQVWEIVIGLLVVGVTVLLVAILLPRRPRPPPS